MDEVTATQAASLTGLSERTIRRRIASGSLPARGIAPNRFAINVRDLPLPGNDAELATQVEVLERRVRALEEQQLALLQRIEQSIGVEPSDVRDISVAMVSELLAQVSQDAERLAPLLGAPDTLAEARVQSRPSSDTGLTHS